MTGDGRPPDVRVPPPPDGWRQLEEPGRGPDEGAGGTPRLLPLRPQGWVWVYAAIWLVFLVPAVLKGAAMEDRPRGIAGIVVVVAFSGFYLRSWADTRARRISGAVAPPRLAAAVLATAVGLSALAVALLGQPALATTPFLVVLFMFWLGERVRLAATVLLIALAGLGSYLVPGWSRDDSILISLVLTSVIMWGISRMLERTAELARANERIASLAVAEERARFARDLHDLLGHSLTLLAIKAELAGRLVRLDVDRAEKEIMDVERVVRDTLSDVRAAVGGYRQANLTGELVSARVVLDAAGIDAELPAAVDDVPGERRELLGWAVREGDTNVVRHSGARRCRIVVDRDAVEIHDDGEGPAPAREAAGWTLGSGLRGLRERAEAVGATVVVGASPDGGFRLRVGW